jgi:hypothetical protein
VPLVLSFRLYDRHDPALLERAISCFNIVSFERATKCESGILHCLEGHKEHRLEKELKHDVEDKSHLICSTILLLNQINRYFYHYSLVVRFVLVF